MMTVATVNAQPEPVSFEPVLEVPVGESGGHHPIAVTTGDFDGDQKPDIATANNFSDTVSVLLGNGDGTFARVGLFPTGDPASGLPFGPAAIVSADVNGDHQLDLIVSNEMADTIAVLLGKGNGTFEAPIDTPVGFSPEGLVVVDLNRDGILDVAVANLFETSVSVLLGNNDGTFDFVDDLGTDDSPLGVAAGDLNGDDVPDLVISVSGAAEVTVYFGAGDGTFGGRDEIAVGMGPSGLIVEDLDGDSFLDVAVANEQSDSASVLLGVGDGSFDIVLEFGVGGFPEALAVADFNLDEVPDLITADSLGTDQFPFGSVSVLAGEGDGGFAAAQAFEVGASPFSVAVADFNGDGSPDAVGANAESDTVSLLINANVPNVCVGDCDGDARVTIDELVRGVNIAFGLLPIEMCKPFDSSGDNQVTVEELIRGVGNSLDGCSAR